ncbi:MAG: acyltransferase family protein [Sphingomonas sp.]|uniref:acyltransferase family protein n=1 Tax=Sphingomonas sp. TaxID=28214 RepID=UPI003F8045E2
MDMSKPTRVRDEPLDAMRGIAIFGMVLANLQGSEAHAFWWINHAPWDGLTIADLVFPMFLLAVGLALPLTMDGRMPRPSIARIVRRSALLWIIGFGISLIVHFSLKLSEIRFTGVLERIGIVYLICAVTCRQTTTWKGPAIAAGVLMLVHGILLHLPAPGELIGSMRPGEGMSGWFDHTILGGTRLYGHPDNAPPFDPEGPLSTLSAIATTMIGIAVQRMSVRRKKPVIMIAAVAILCLGLTVAAAWFWPINKNLWTPTFTLVNAAIGLGLLALLKIAWPRVGGSRIAQTTSALGAVSLTLYVVHDAVAIVMMKVPIGDAHLGKRLLDAIAATGLPLDWTSMLYAMILGAISIVIALFLRRRGWVLKV